MEPTVSSHGASPALTSTNSKTTSLLRKLKYQASSITIRRFKSTSIVMEKRELKLSLHSTPTLTNKEKNAVFLLTEDGFHGILRTWNCTIQVSLQVRLLVSYIKVMLRLNTQSQTNQLLWDSQELTHMIFLWLLKWTTEMKPVNSCLCKLITMSKLDKSYPLLQHSVNSQTGKLNLKDMRLTPQSGSTPHLLVSSQTLSSGSISECEAIHINGLKIFMHELKSH